MIRDPHAPNTVYRVYDEADRLIYIGCSVDFESRILQHRLSSWWAYTLAWATEEILPDRVSGFAAEAAAIRAEHPRWNVANQAPRSEWLPEHYRDYVIGRASDSALYRDHPQFYWRVFGTEYTARFGRPFPLHELIAEAIDNAAAATAYQSRVEAECRLGLKRIRDRAKVARAA